MKTFDGYKKRNLTDKDYALLAGGGHKALDTLFSALSSDTTNAIKVTVGGTEKSITTSTLKTSLGLGSNAYTSTAYLPLAGGTIIGNIILKGRTSTDMTYAGNVHPYIRFDNSDSSLNISLIFTDYDAYRSPAGIKLVGNQGSEWFEAANIYATTFYGTLSGNASSATKLTSSAGSATLPIYFSDGKPVACTASSVFSNLSNSGNNISVTVAGQNRTLTPAYATNCDTVDGYHQGNAVHYIWTNIYTQPTSGATWYLKIKTTDWKSTSDWIWVRCEGNNAYDEYVINTGSRSTAWWAYGVQYTHQLIDGCTKIISKSCDTYIRLTSGCTRVRLYATFTPASVTNDSASSYTTIVPGLNAPTFYGNATSATNSDTCDGLHVHGSRNNEANKIVRTDGSGYLQVGYINSSNGHEKNASSPTYVWGSNASDSYLRSYQTSKLAVYTASKWATARKITLTGSVTGSVYIDGSGDVTLATTTNHTHSYLPLSGGTMTGVITSSFASSTWINGVTNAVIKGTYTGYGAILSMPVKGGRVSLSSYPANDNNIYFGYATTAQINAGTNAHNKQMYWDAANNNLHADTFTGALSGNASTATNADKLDGKHASDFAAASHTHSYLPLSGGTCTGNIYAPHFYESSDIRYKKILRNLSITSNTIANLPLFDFEWIENNSIGTGTSAQEVQEILPNIVSGTDKLTLDYGVLGTIAGITACKELVNLKSEIEKLKERIKELELQLKMINDYGRC